MKTVIDCVANPVELRYSLTNDFCASRAVRRYGLPRLHRHRSPPHRTHLPDPLEGPQQRILSPKLDTAHRVTRTHVPPRSVSAAYHESMTYTTRRLLRVPALRRLCEAARPVRALATSPPSKRKRRMSNRRGAAGRASLSKLGLYAKVGRVLGVRGEHRASYVYCVRCLACSSVQLLAEPALVPILDDRCACTRSMVDGRCRGR